MEVRQISELCDCNEEDASQTAKNTTGRTTEGGKGAKSVGLNRSVGRRVELCEGRVEDVEPFIWMGAAEHGEVVKAAEGECI